MSKDDMRTALWWLFNTRGELQAVASGCSRGLVAKLAGFGLAGSMCSAPQVSAGEHPGELDEGEVELLLAGRDLGERGPGDLAALLSDEHAVLPAGQRLGGGGSQAGGEQAVESAGDAAALHMAEDGHPQIETQALAVLVEVPLQAQGVHAAPLGHHDQGV